MKNVKEQILSDAIEQYVISERENIRLQRRLDIVSIICCIEAFALLCVAYSKLVGG